MSDGWKILKRAIPDGAAKAVAHRLHLHPDHVRRWRREPLSDEAPLASGQRSILDRFKELQEAIYLVNPQGPCLLIEDLKTHYDELIGASMNPGYWDRRGHAAAALREVVEAVNCLNLDASDEDTLQELIEAQRTIEEAILRVRRRPRECGGSEAGSTAAAGRSPERESGRLVGRPLSGEGA